MFRVAWLQLLFCASLLAQPVDAEKLAPYYPTPQTIVDKMLQLGGLKAGERVYDLGSGDGRIVIMAAEKFTPMPSELRWTRISASSAWTESVSSTWRKTPTL
jgi:hypothetical protein